MRDDKLGPPARQLPPVLRRFGIWVALMTCLSEAFDFVLRFLFHRRPPYGGSFAWEDTNTDFELFRFRFAYFHTPRFWDAPGFPFDYPAPLGVVYWLLYKLPYGAWIYLGLGIAALAVWAWYFAKELALRGVSRSHALLCLVLFVPLCWPVRMLLQDGNLETVLAIVLGAGVVAASRERWYLAAGLIGLAGSMKIYPLILLGLVLSQRRYREFAWGVAIAVAVTLASLWWLGPSVVEAQRHIDVGLAYIVNRDALLPVANGLQGSHSLFNLVKIAVAVADHLTHAPSRNEAGRALVLAREYLQMRAALKVYLPVLAVLATAMYWLRLRHMPLLNQIVGLSVCAVLLPADSLDYTLVNLLVPLGMVCVFAAEQWQKREQPRGLAVCLACFAFIFTTGDYFRLKYLFASQVRTLAMLVLLAMVVRFPYRLSSSHPAGLG
jgi:hypothetical protein